MKNTLGYMLRLTKERKLCENAHFFHFLTVFFEILSGPFCKYVSNLKNSRDNTKNASQTNNTWYKNNRKLLSQFAKKCFHCHNCYYLDMGSSLSLSTAKAEPFGNFLN